MHPTPRPRSSRPRARHLVVAVLAATLLLVGGHTPTAQATPQSAEELAFHSKLNDLRRFFGGQGLHWDDALAASARSWSSHMIAAGGLGHDPGLSSALTSALGPIWTRGGENVGRGFGVDSIHAAFVNSGPHLANMIGDFNRVGIGVVRSGNEIWVTYRFAKAATPGPGSQPTGSIDGLTQTGDGRVDISGWALDPDSTAPIDVHVYVDGRWGGSFRTGASRPDVAAYYPLYGANRGYAGTLNGLGLGTRNVCAYGINAPGTPGGNPLFGCRTVKVVAMGSPFGSMDSVVATGPGVLQVSGWAIDPDTTAAVDVDVLVDGVVRGSGVANTWRPDVGAAYPGMGNNHGYVLQTTGVGGGDRTVCVRGKNKAGSGTTATIACTNVTVPATPFGSVDSVSSPAAGKIRVSGWAIDPEVASPIGIHVYVDGRWGGLTTADQLRADVGAVFPPWGPMHGFTLTIDASRGTHSVCTYAINAVGTVGGNPLLACRSVFVA